MRCAALAAVLAGGAGFGVAAQDLRIGLAVEPTAADPHFWSGMTNVTLARHFFDDLIIRDKTQQFHPGLALSWRPLDDTTWEFKLRPGVKFHDGTAFTADDVIASVRRILKPDLKTTAGGYASFVRGKELVKIDDHTLQVKTAKPYPLMVEDMANFPVIARAHADASLEDFNSGKAAVGTGPYRLVEWVTADRLVLQANPAYWGGKSKWDRVTMRPVKATAARIAALLNGDVDLIEKVSTTDVKDLEKNPNITVSSRISNRNMYLHVDSNRHVSPFVLANDGKPLFPNPLRDWRVRKALSMAVNRQAIVERVMEGQAHAASQLVPDFVFGFNPNLKIETFDPEGARKLLAQAGYADGFRVTVHGPNDRYVNDAKIIETVAQMWTRVGVKTEVVAQPVSVYSPRATRLEYSIVLFGYGAEAAEAYSPLRAVLETTNREGGACCSNRGRYSNVLFDAKLQESVAIVDRAARQKLLQEAAEIAVADVAIIPLHTEVNIWAARKGVVYEARTDETTLAESASRAR